MGFGIVVQCHSCIYRKEFFLGSGMYHSSLENCIESLHRRTQVRVRAIISDRKVNEHYFGNCLIHCEKCGKLFGRPMLTVVFQDGEEYETSKRCSKCRKDGVIKKSEEIPTLPCPKCKQKTLGVIDHILWD